VRAQEMARYVESGAPGRGDYRSRTGWWKQARRSMNYPNWFMRNNGWRAFAGYWAVPEDSAIREPRDLEGKVIATEVVHITESYLAKHGR